jgi:hypothetical protein
MIGVFLLKRIIAVIRRVTAISDLLKPATWEKIAIAHGLVGLSFLLVYGFLDRRVQETDIPSVAILPAQVRSGQPALWSPNPEIVDIIAVEPSRVGQDFTLSINGSNFKVGTSVILIDTSNSTSDVAKYASITHLSTHLLTSQALRSSYTGHEVALSSIGDFVPGGWNLPSIGAPERHVVLQPGSPSGQSLLETVLKLLALFQGITMMINGSVASILGLIAYHRNKVDMAVKHLDLELKRLQILQIREALDKQARERLKEAEEAARSSIILTS